MERTPKKIPLPCFGLENSKYNPKCVNCEFFDDCLVYMGSRAGKIPLSKLKFNILPKNIEPLINVIDIDDPDSCNLTGLYATCYRSVFEKQPLKKDSVTRYKNEIFANAAAAGCSLRMFMLANMQAHVVHEETKIEHTDCAIAAPFIAKHLATARSVKRAKTYEEMCRNKFGTFSANHVSLLTGGEGLTELEHKMQNSELIIAREIVRFKIFSSEPFEKRVFDNVELELAPEWLALDAFYLEHVLTPYLANKRGNEAIRAHRFKVIQVIGHYKKHLSEQKHAWAVRQAQLPAVVTQLLNTFGYRPDSFMYPDTAVTDIVEFWKKLSLAIRHNHCLRFLDGEPSLFAARRLICSSNPTT